MRKAGRKAGTLHGSPRIGNRCELQARHKHSLAWRQAVSQPVVHALLEVKPSLPTEREPTAKDPAGSIETRDQTQAQQLKRNIIEGDPSPPPPKPLPPRS